MSDVEHPTASHDGDTASLETPVALSQLRRAPIWRCAVWGLRLEAAGLAVIVAGLLVSIAARDPGLRAVVAGMVVVAAGALATIVGMVLVYRHFGSSRPSDDLLRRALARDLAGLDRR